MMFVISSPSGAGKSTLTRHLIDKENDLSLSISVTTRPQRSSEVNGVHYHFVSPETFHDMRQNRNFLEYAEVHGYFYGTPRKNVEQQLNKGLDVLFDVDVQGVTQLYQNYAENLVSVFILPPSIQELHQRLKRRAEDSEERITHRLENAQEEFKSWEKYDYVLVNHELETCLCELQNIFTAERMKRRRQRYLTEHVKELSRELKTFLEDRSPKK